MKRTPLRRKTPLRSRGKSWGAGRRRRGPNLKAVQDKHRTKYARRERDYERMQWIRTQPCAVAAWCQLGWMGPPADACSGGVEAHHAGRHGHGNKAPDDTCIPLCRHHHESITGKPGGRGCFDGWPRGAVKAWEIAVIGIYQHRYANRGNPPF